MPHRFVFKTQFLGTKFCGSQLQKNGRTVQEELEKAFNIYFRKKIKVPIKVTLGSRVDSGVHSSGMIGHFDLDEPLNPLDRGLLASFPCQGEGGRRSDRVSENQILCNLNGILPKDISVIKIGEIHDSFHSVKDAIRRSYVYKLRAHSPRCPLDESQVTYLYQGKKLNIESLNRQASKLIGEHDFTGLSNFNRREVYPVCKVFEAHWKQDKNDEDLLLFTVTANRFLYNMIRVIVGTQIAAENAKLYVRSGNCLSDIPQEISIDNALKYRDRKLAGPTMAPTGLCLKAIEYPFPLFN